jgi:glutathione synthase/RimK-type ligase-like ATP-grasp enzyme
VILRPAMARSGGPHDACAVKRTGWAGESRRVAVVASAPSETNLDLARSWQELGLAVDVLTPSAALAVLEPGDAALGRIDVLPSLDGVENGLAELTSLHRRGIRVLNAPGALLCARDKLRTARALETAGVPAPKPFTACVEAQVF